MSSKSLTNVYYERKVADPGKPCFVCYKPTTCVLATIDLSDYFYTCTGHLSDPGFATELNPPQPPTLSLPTTKDKEPKEKGKGKEKEKEKDEDKGKDKDNKKDDNDEKKKTSNNEEKEMTQTTSNQQQQSQENKPKQHKKYALHSSVFNMRKQMLRKAQFASSARSISATLPDAPTTALPKNQQYPPPQS